MEDLMLKEEIAERFGLSSDQVTDQLLVKLAEDPSFVYHLEVCKADPQMLRIVLGEAEHRASESNAGLRPTSVEIMGKAGIALARWAASGFGRVDPEEYRRRLSICNACEHLSEPPDDLIYRLAPISKTRSICGLCGCDVRRKAWLITERCPDDVSGEGGRWSTGQ
jgi:hypothetical protein